MSQTSSANIPPHLRGLSDNQLPPHLRGLHSNEARATVQTQDQSSLSKVMENQSSPPSQESVKTSRTLEKQTIPNHLRRPSTQSAALSQVSESTIHDGGVAITQGDLHSRFDGMALGALKGGTRLLGQPPPRSQAHQTARTEQSHQRKVVKVPASSLWGSSEDSDTSVEEPKKKQAPAPIQAQPSAPTLARIAAPPKQATEKKPGSNPAPAQPVVRTGDAAEWTKKTEPAAKFRKQFPCSYENCLAGFDKLKVLQRHKLENHDYCRICDLDCDDFQDLLDHKILSPKHITCHICSEDFRSSGGRDGHVKRFHAMEQKIPCPGCTEVFIRAGGLVNHIEQNLCSKITKDQFQRSRAMQALVVAHMSALAVPEEDESILDLGEPDIGGSPGGVALNQEVLVPENVGRTLDNVYPALPNTQKTPAHSGDQTNQTPGAVSTGASQREGIGAWSASAASAASMLFPNATSANRSRAAGDAEGSTNQKQRFTEDQIAELVIGGSDTVSRLALPGGASVEAIDPDSYKFDPDAFRNVLGNYVCPHANCG